MIDGRGEMIVHPPNTGHLSSPRYVHIVRCAMVGKWKADYIARYPNLPCEVRRFWSRGTT